MNCDFGKQCPICGNTGQTYLFELHESSVAYCEGCDLCFSSPIMGTHQRSYFAVSAHEVEPDSELSVGKTEMEACKNHLQLLIKRSADIQNILVVAEPGHCFLSIARDFGLNIVRHVSINELETGLEVSQSVDAVVIIFQLERSESLERALRHAYEVLRLGGELLVVTLSLDSRSARFLGQSWTGWQPQNRFYFNNTNIQLALWRYGFRDVWVEKDIRPYTLAHINKRASALPHTWVTSLIRAAYGTLPSTFHNVFLRLPSSGIVVMARKGERNVPPMLSIILPVYNEGATFAVLMDQLLALKLANIQKEIIIIESNSKDNSRELVLQYEHCPGVKVILQEKALGKGNAVRAGFEKATGDVLLIQNADLEYDLNDYESLIEPVLSCKKPFVLGARHGGKWKMRHFADQKQLSIYLNLGHILFTTFLNWVYGQRLKDPFTMFKIFRRDCLYNLKLECNRFDFDFELVIKLIRKGYSPVEIPANYHSRSFADGKKVDMFRDPFTWIRALIKYRFAKITKE